MAYDVIVVGVGGMGSAACWHLARRGLRVLGLERFDIPNAMGSSHGSTRIIRLPYHEDAAYVPLLRRAYALWRELEAATGRRVLHVTGSLDIGPEHGELFGGALLSARLHDLPHEVLTGAQVNGRFPGYSLPPDVRAVWQPDGGFVASERAVCAHVAAAQADGAEIRARERVLAWSADAAGVRVETDRGSCEAERLVLTAGAWMADLAPELAPLAQPERQVLAWLQPQRPALFEPQAFPVFNMEAPDGRWYGLPVFDVPGFKLGRYHHRGETTSAEGVRREVDAEDEALLRGFASAHFPAGCGPTMALRACLFTNTPDGRFIIDRHPAHERVVIASPCSGHGYKFCSVVGEVVADLVAGASRPDVDFLRLGRFAT